MSRHNLSYADQLFAGFASIPAFNAGKPGLPMARLVTYGIKPLTKQAANLVASVTPAGAGALTVIAGTSVTAVTISPQSVPVSAFQLDVPRNIVITGSTNATSANVTVTGFDAYYQPMTETIASPVGATTTAGKKAFAFIVSATISGGTTAAITIGTGDVLGLPFYLEDINNVVAVKWASALADDAGTAVKGDMTAATASTGDVRGTYAPSSASDGTRKLLITYSVSDAVAGRGLGDAANAIAGAFGVLQA